MPGTCGQYLEGYYHVANILATAMALLSFNSSALMLLNILQDTKHSLKKCFITIIAIGDLLWAIGIIIHNVATEIYGNLGYCSFGLCIAMRAWNQFWGSSIILATLLIAVYIFLYLYYPHTLPDDDATNRPAALARTWPPILAFVYLFASADTILLLSVPNTFVITRSGWCELTGRQLFWNLSPIFIFFVVILFFYSLTMIKYLIQFAKQHRSESANENATSKSHSSATGVRLSLNPATQAALQSLNVMSLRLSCFAFAYLVVFSGEVVHIFYRFLYPEELTDNPPAWIVYWRFIALSASGFLDMIAYGLLSSEFRSRYSLLSFLLHWTFAPPVLVWQLALTLLSFCGCGCLNANELQQRLRVNSLGANSSQVNSTATSYSSVSSANDSGREASVNFQASTSSGDDRQLS